MGWWLDRGGKVRVGSAAMVSGKGIENEQALVVAYVGRHFWANVEAVLRKVMGVRETRERGGDHV